MHLYVIAKGIKDHQDRWVNDLLAKYLTYNTTPANAKKLGLPEGKPGLVQLAVRPIQLYEIGFPADQLDEVLKTVRPEGYPQYKLFHKIIKTISKLLGLKPIPEYKKDDGIFRVRNEAVGIIGVGIKDDIFIDGVEQL